MSTSRTVFPELLGADKMILHGTDGTTSAPIRGCFVSHRSCFATWIWSGLPLDETMALTFTMLSNSLIGLHKRVGSPHPMHQLLRGVRHRFALLHDLLPGRSRHIALPGCCRARAVSSCCSDRSGRCPVCSAVRSLGAADLSSQSAGF